MLAAARRGRSGHRRQARRSRPTHAKKGRPVPIQPLYLYRQGPSKRHRTTRGGGGGGARRRVWGLLGIRSLHLAIGGSTSSCRTPIPGVEPPHGEGTAGYRFSFTTAPPPPLREGPSCVLPVRPLLFLFVFFFVVFFVFFCRHLPVSLQLLPCRLPTWRAWEKKASSPSSRPPPPY